MDQLAAENEALHALLADCCATLMAYSEMGWEGAAARECLERVKNVEPLPAFRADG